MKKKFVLLLVMLSIFLSLSSFAQEENRVLNKGLWVSVFSKDKALYSNC